MRPVGRDRAWWAEPNPQGRTSGTKRFNRHLAGPIIVEWESFTLPDEPSQTLFIYTAADRASQEAMTFLTNWWPADENSDRTSRTSQ